ncbi:glycoside hydrolase family 3 protein [Glycomyces algeriensis]|uniref:Beta-glucosidase n=1 Tax=Glycomyces algeriensis TaxID=256037 RepID=A0A9W6G8M3_9ACTN|nr:glycoside hydrolase family 3 C-terminal domain-containing protein [Glycomyces algeriensis]MDA1367987.1 glycoside hydrolase family 3 C-terminal domain-containing protein [Glycomyces algeriensis]MDR7349526.1 beta-glucosidase [Glycomyces algeriensis]GLI42233.1 beta-glucosidase [Glycomyces algeriensis]
MSDWVIPDDRPEYAEAVEAALAKMDLETKADLLAGLDMWRTIPVPEAGLRSMTVSDGPIGVRGRFWTAADPSLALPSPTAQAASWDPELVRRIGNLLAAESRRKDVDVLLAPTINLQRSPLGGRHFEAFSEDPYLTGRIAQAYVAGIQECGVGTTMKHYVANDAETDRFTVDNIIGERALRELYLRPFEMITAAVRPWGVMTAYNAVNGHTMTAHRELMAVLREEFGFDGFNVSDWGAARHTVEGVEAGLDLAMPGPFTVYGKALVAAVREGRTGENHVDEAVRRMLKLAARVGALEGVRAAVDERVEAIADPEALLREIAQRSFVLVQNNAPEDGGAPALPLAADAIGGLALIGPAAAEARILGGGSATVFPSKVVSPLDGLREALGDRVRYAQGVDLFEKIQAAGKGFDLKAYPVRKDGTGLPPLALASGDVKWMGYLPGDLAQDEFSHAVVEGVFTVETTGEHVFGTRGTGLHRLVIGGEVVFDGEHVPSSDDPFEAFFGPAVERATVHLEAGQQVSVRHEHTPVSVFPPGYPPSVLFGLMHAGPRPDEDRLIAEAVEAARAADVAVVVVSTTALTESEGFDRRDLRLPGRQDELVAAVAEANPNTVVVVNTGSPVEMPWSDGVAAILLTWFPGQEGGHALADVLLGAEPGGRLTTTWPRRLEDAPVVQVVPTDGELHYDEGVFIGYRAWEQRDAAEPAFWFGHGLSYTEWTYEDLQVDAGEVTVRVRNSGTVTGREVVQVYLSPEAGLDLPGGIEPHRLAGFAAIEAAPGETVDVAIPLEDRSFQYWDEAEHAWRQVPGGWTVAAGRSVADLRLRASVKPA